jgi:hypothetical protein
MDELGELILGEKPKVERQPNIVAPKKSPMSGLNPQLQYKEEKPDELGQLILGSETTETPTQVTAKRVNPIEQLRQKQLADIQGVGEAGRSVLSGMISAPVSALAGIAGTLTSGKFGTPQGIQAGQKTAQNVQEALTYQPPSERGQQILQDLQSKFEASKLPPVGVPEVMGMGMGQKPQPIQAPKIRIEPVGPRVTQPSSLQPAGAAATTNKAILEQAIAQVSPEVAAELKSINPKDLNVKALSNITEAESLPVPVKLTLGQASEDANLISREKNDRAVQQEFLQRFNEQNKALQENVNLVKEKTAPDVFAPNYVANAEGALEYVSSKVKQYEEATSKAYKELDDFGAGKIQVDSKTFADNAMKALKEKEDIDFLPPVIEKRVKAYQEGKEMNFDQLNNFTSQISKETRKAEKAGDGNTVHALNLLRGELEKLPLINETAEAKPFADKARATAKAMFDLLNPKNEKYNKTFADYVNGSTDTKDFIQSAILRSKNKDFAKTMELFDDPTAKQHLRAGALDVIIKDATDASGNFKPAKFNKAIENLDVNGKLTPLFGEDAITLKKIARAGQLVEARPTGHYVNEPNTAVEMAAQYAKRVAGQVPIVGRFVEPGQQLLQERALKKEVKKSLKPGAGAKLSDIGK